MSATDLSIIIPTYNRLPLLKEALDSFVGKLPCSYEAIIVDDGSADGTPDYLRTLGEPCRVFSQEHKGGSAARNYGLREARGRYVKFLDDDDLLEPETTVAQVDLLDCHPELDVCYADWTQLVENVDGQPLERRKRIGQVDDPIDAFLSVTLGGPPFIYLIRRAKALQIMWDETLPYLQDFDFLLRLALSGAHFGYVPGFGGCNRMHHHGWGKVSLASPEIRVRTWLRVFGNAQVVLATNNQLTDARRQLLASRYFLLAEQAFPIDRSLFCTILEKVHDTWPEFEPDRPRFRFLVRLFGYEVSERLRFALGRVRQPPKG